MTKHSTRNPVGVTPLGIVMATTGHFSLTKSSRHGCLCRYHTSSKRSGMILHNSSLKMSLYASCFKCAMAVASTLYQGTQLPHSAAFFLLLPASAGTQVV